MKQIEKRHSELGRIARDQSLKSIALSEMVASVERNHRIIGQNYLADYRHPDLGELYRIHEEQERWSKIAKIGDSLGNIETTIASISVPWIKLETPNLSIAGFAALQGVGAAVRHIGTFDSGVLEVLTRNLGDWHGLPKWPKRILENSDLRTEFYVQHGLNKSLTDFPKEVFDAGLDSAGLGNADLGVLEFEEVFAEPESDDNRAIRRRAIACFEILYIFEEKLRLFIDRELSSKFGPEWPKSRLPAGMKDSWVAKKDMGAAPGGTSGALIDFADFTDYEKIICKKDNWRDVFAPFFARPELVQMAFYFLRPIRLTIMHARKPTYNDELYLRAEVTKLSQFLGGT